MRWERKRYNKIYILHAKIKLSIIILKLLKSKLSKTDASFLSREHRASTSQSRVAGRGKGKARKNNIGEKERVYLVLRVCRVCNHRGTAKRPSTPSHSASRHSIFFSPRARYTSVCRCPSTTFLGSLNSPAIHDTLLFIPRFFFPLPLLPRRNARVLYNHYQLSQTVRVRFLSCFFSL